MSGKTTTSRDRINELKQRYQAHDKQYLERHAKDISYLQHGHDLYEWIQYTRTVAAQKRLKDDEVERFVQCVKDFKATNCPEGSEGSISLNVECAVTLALLLLSEIAALRRL